MRILVFNDDFPPEARGGSAVVAFNLAKSLKSLGHEVAVVTTVQDKQKAGNFEYEGIKVFKLYSRYHERWRAYLSVYNPQTVKLIKKIIFEFKPNIVHAHNVHQYLSYHALKLAKKLGAKVILTAHDAMLYHYGKHEEKNIKITQRQLLKRYKFRFNPFRKLAIKYYLRYVDKIIAVSEALKKALEENGIHGVGVIHNGIDVSLWQKNETDIQVFKRKYNLENKKIVLFGGRLSALKGGEQIVRAMTQVLEEVQEAVLLVLGRIDSYAESLQNLAEDLGIGQNIVFTDWVSGDELKAAYHASDLVTVPSIYSDPFPTVNLEAAACSKGVVATSLGGTLEIVIDGQTGYVVNPNDLDTLSARIIDLLKNPQKAEMFGENGYQRVLENFDLEKQVKSYLEYFN